MTEPLIRASKFLAERKAAMTGTRVGEGIGLADYETGVRALCVGTDMNPDVLADVAQQMSDACLTVCGTASAQYVPSVVASFIVDAVMHGYHAHRLEAEDVAS